MAQYMPSFPFNVAMRLLIPSESTVRGVNKKTFPDSDNSPLIYCSFKSYGGTEVNNNGVVSVLDTAVIETWYRPDIRANCRLCLASEPERVYEIMGTPENIEMRNQFLKFKIQAVAGGA